MYDFGSLAKGFRYFEQIKNVDDMNDSGLWAQGFRWFEQLRTMDDVNDLGSHEIKALVAMKSSWLQITWMTPGYELRAQNSITSLGLLMISMTRGHVLKALLVSLEL